MRGDNGLDDAEAAAVAMVIGLIAGCSENRCCCALSYVDCASESIDSVIFQTLTDASAEAEARRAACS